MPTTTCLASGETMTFAFDLPPGLMDAYGTVTALDYRDGGPHVTVLLHSGLTITLRPEIDGWIARREDTAQDLDVTDLVELFGESDDDFRAEDTFDELWRTAYLLCEQLTGHAVRAHNRHLVDLLVRLTTTRHRDRPRWLALAERLGDRLIRWAAAVDRLERRFDRH